MQEIITLLIVCLSHNINGAHHPLAFVHPDAVLVGHVIVGHARLYRPLRLSARRPRTRLGNERRAGLSGYQEVAEIAGSISAGVECRIPRSAPVAQRLCRLPAESRYSGVRAGSSARVPPAGRFRSPPGPSLSGEWPPDQLLIENQRTSDPSQILISSAKASIWGLRPLPSDTTLRIPAPLRRPNIAITIGLLGIPGQLANRELVKTG